MGTSPPAPGTPRGASDKPTTRRARGPYRQQLGAERPGQPAVGVNARRTAAVILEVLAGVRTPGNAAAALGIGLPRYYLWEQRAIEGLVAACQPRPQGRTVSSDRRIADLQRELAVAQRELARQQALTRTAQRALGWMPPAPSPTKTAAAPPRAAPAPGTPKRRTRRPAVRALRAVRALLAGDQAVAKPGTAAVQPAPETTRAGGDCGGEKPPPSADTTRRTPQPQQADHGGPSHAGRPKAPGHL